MFVFDINSSIILYMVLIFVAIIFAYLAEKFSKRGLNKFFWLMSFLFLWIPVAFRASGVDHTSYYNYFFEAQALGTDYFSSYQGSPEPLFALLVYLIVTKVNSFQYIYIVTSFIALFFTYLGFAKMFKKTSLALTVMWFSATYYMTFYGLVRMSVAVGIITYAFSFIEQHKMKKFFFFCTIATLFHYSAGFMFVIYFLFRRKENLKYSKEQNISDVFITSKSIAARKLLIKKTQTNKRLIIQIVLIGVLLYAIYKAFPYFCSGFIWYSKYAYYFNFEPTLLVINNLAGFYLLFILLLLWQKEVKTKMNEGVLYVNLVWSMLAIGIFSSIFPVTRLTYYLMPIGCYTYGFIPRLLEKRLRLLLYIVYLVLGIAWWYYVYMTPGLWGNYILPYEMNLKF